MFKRLAVLVIVLSLALPGMTSVALARQGQPQQGPPQFIEHRGQQLFLNGINLGWIKFGYDLKDFDETTWVAIMDDIASAHGNSVRWWLHVNGSASPVYGDDGKVSGLGENDIKNFKRAVDLAYERGVLVLPTLWSFDMLRTQEGVPTEWNKLLIEDPAYTQAYIDNALTPLVTALAGHPGIIAWEICNEPEGMTEEFGWSEVRTTMPYIQQWTNLLPGAIHRADPQAKVTNGSWNLRLRTDVGGFTSSYPDARLIAAGGDELGTLDFYQVHFYQEHFGDDTSPFHNPASHWELDKPLLIGEFPAAGIKDLGRGYRPEGRIMRNSIESYQNLYENGYAVAMAWRYYQDDVFGRMLDAKPGLITIFKLAPEHVVIDLGDLDRIPVITAPIDNVFVPNTQAEAVAATLADVFEDVEDGDNLSYEITLNTNPDLITPTISDAGELLLTFTVGQVGTGSLEVTAPDSAGNSSSAAFVVQVTDPNRGNVALGKPITASTLESQAYLAEYAVDGVETTRWSTQYADDQWLMVDLEGVFEIGQFTLEWETAYGRSYELQTWDGSAWQTVFAEQNSDGGIDDIVLDAPVLARYVRMHGIERGTQWGFSLWEFEVYGVRAEGDYAALETVPPSDVPAAAEPEAAPAVLESSLLYSFEDDLGGWVMADYWPAGRALEQSTGQATEGSASLMLSGEFSGTTWEEMGVYIDPPDGLDLSAYDALSLDVYAPAEASGFIAQVFMKTGDGWAWVNTADTALVPGEWTTITAELSKMGDPAAVKEIGVKIGTSTTAFSGAFYVDNVQVIDLGETAAEAEAAAPTGPMLSRSMMLYSFEKGTGEWVMADYWPAGRALDQSTEWASAGSASLMLSGEFSGTAWEEMGVYIDPPDGRDWSSWDTLSVDVYAPAEASGFIAQVFMKTGDGWTWVNTPDIALVPGEWTTLTADLSQMGDAAAVKEFGVKIGTSTTAFSGAFYIDGVRLSGEEPAPLPEPVLFASFEDGLEGWVMADYWPAGRALDQSTEMATEGSASLKLTGEFSGTAWEEMGVYIDPPDGADWSMYPGVSVDVYAPAEASGFIAQVFMKTGDGWTWVNTPDIALVPGEWTTLTADLSQMGDAAAVKEIGVKIGTSTTAFSGAFYIDRVVVGGDSSKKN